ncbi:MAG: PBP1A family penicillin-binding protein [Acidobacteria bacterium]|nr:PBP1A family penicillin-binding protein [Acidobacteriota bacterium]
MGFRGWAIRVGLASLLLFLVVSAGILTYFYFRFSRAIDARFSGDVFNRTATVFAAPYRIRPEQELTPDDVARRLRRAGYSEEEDRSPLGYYRVGEDFVQVYPGPASIRKGTGAASLHFRDGKVNAIVRTEDSRPLADYYLEPEMVTTLFDRSRTKRRLLRYADIPDVMRNAILATEDRQFFSHFGISFRGVVSAAIDNLRRPDAPLRGASTITMQLAKNFFLTPERTFKRKIAQAYFSLLLEARLSKEEIFELYANQIYLGQRGSFAIHGVGEASRAYFDKDISSITLPEAALLTAMLPAPSRYSPYRHPDRAKERRDLVIRQMVEFEVLTEEEAKQAQAVPVQVASRNVEASQAPYFIDMVREQLLGRFSEPEILSQGFRVYTTLDLDLQKAASEAVQVGIEQIDRRLDELQEMKILKRPDDPLQPQVCLVALDPFTGALRAVVGGRNYGASQLNHALAKRQPGSSFKPFVYAAALSSAVDGSSPLITTASTIVDEPTRFEFGTEFYEPANYREQYHGVVTLRKALALSLNVAAVKLAETIGYWKVEELATQAGFNREVEATPAIALGAYASTPLEITGAYTIFANQGEYRSPYPIDQVRNEEGEMLWQSPRETRQVLDPRVAYLMTHLLESVVNHGTAAGVRRRGFLNPAAGKTGTSRDGWFVGYTSNLLCAAWVGYDDDRELVLSGASTALPIWTEFMKRATALSAYQDARHFPAPPGVVFRQFEVPEDVYLGEDEPRTKLEVFIEGTEPEVTEEQVPYRSVLNRILTSEEEDMPADPDASSTVPVLASVGELERLEDEPPVGLTGSEGGNSQDPTASASQEPPRSGFRRFFGLFGGSKKRKKNSSGTADSTQPQR